MIMRVTWGKIRPGKWDEYEKLWNAHARETADTPGLQGRWLLRDTETEGAGYSLSLWDDAGAFDAYTAAGGTRNTEQMAGCFVGQYVTNVCEVRGSELTGLKA